MYQIAKRQRTKSLSFFVGNFLTIISDFDILYIEPRYIEVK